MMIAIAYPCTPTSLSRLMQSPCTQRSLWKISLFSPQSQQTKDFSCRRGRDFPKEINERRMKWIYLMERIRNVLAYSIEFVCLQNNNDVNTHFAIYRDTFHFFSKYARVCIAISITSWGYFHATCQCLPSRLSARFLTACLLIHRKGGEFGCQTREEKSCPSKVGLSRRP